MIFSGWQKCIIWIHRRQEELLCDKSDRLVRHYQNRQLQSVTMMMRTNSEAVSTLPGFTDELYDSLSLDINSLNKLIVNTEGDTELNLAELGKLGFQCECKVIKKFFIWVESFTTCLYLPVKYITD